MGVIRKKTISRGTEGGLKYICDVCSADITSTVSPHDLAIALRPGRLQPRNYSYWPALTSARSEFTALMRPVKTLTSVYLALLKGRPLAIMIHASMRSRLSSNTQYLSIQKIGAPMRSCCCWKAQKYMVLGPGRT